MSTALADETREVEISRQDCQAFLAETSFGGADYIPGIDARGKNVVPAEGPIEDPAGDFFIVTVTPDQALPEVDPETKPEEALPPTITYDAGQRSLVFEGRMLNGETSHQIANHCLEHLPH